MPLEEQWTASCLAGGCLSPSPMKFNDVEQRYGYCRRCRVSLFTLSTPIPTRIVAPPRASCHSRANSSKLVDVDVPRVASWRAGRLLALHPTILHSACGLLN